MSRREATHAETVGDRIRQRRLALGLSQRALAAGAVSPAYVSLLEANRRTASLKTLRTLAPRLRVSVYWLETGATDDAVELARIVMRHRTGPLPQRARVLALSLLAAARDEG
jgi:transcriptional regulator with XRE-family HTH domain